MDKPDTYIVGYMINNLKINSMISELTEQNLITPQNNTHVTLLYLGKNNIFQPDDKFYNCVKSIKQIDVAEMKICFIGRNLVLELLMTEEQNKSVRECINEYEKSPPVPFLHVTLGKIKDRNRSRINKYLLSKYPNGIYINKCMTTDMDIIHIDHRAEKYTPTKRINWSNLK
jgi:hypothetical protein